MSPEPDLRYTLVNLMSASDPATGDIYSGLDWLGWVKYVVRWRSVAMETHLF